MRIQIEEQVVEQVGVVVSHIPENPAVPIVLGMNILKDLDLVRLLARYEHLGRQAHGCGL